MRGMRFTACFTLASVNDEIIDRAFQACQQAAVCELDDEPRGLLQVQPLQTATANGPPLKRGCRSTCPVARSFLTSEACATVIQHALLECAVPGMQKTAVARCQNQPRTKQDGELRRQLGELLRATCRMVCIACARSSRRAQKCATLCFKGQAILATLRP